ncbi:MAG: hypothetical protein WD595_00040 [Waddliaceae bacterium]
MYPYASYQLQQYNDVQTAFGSVPRSTVDHFVTLGIYTFYDIYAAEAEILLAETKSNPFGFDSTKITLRYRWLDDIIGDYMSVVFGTSYIQTVTKRRDDISSFHHGNVEGEFHVSAGKEFSCGHFWYSRYWGLAAIGVADKGSPWLRGHLQFDYNHFDLHRYGIFLQTLVGLGNQKLNLNQPFHGYGPIHHQSVNVGVEYRYDSFCFGILEVEYKRRLFARNFPEDVNLFKLTYTYPFGL